MQTTFKAKSSSGEAYDVIFSIAEGRMTVRCSCKAGLLLQQCKHKRRLISGEREMLVDQSQTEILDQMRSTPEASVLVARLAIEEAALGALEEEKNKIATEEKVIKRNIGNLLARGV